MESERSEGKCGDDFPGVTILNLAMKPKQHCINIRCFFSPYCCQFQITHAGEPIYFSKCKFAGVSEELQIEEPQKL